MLRHSWLGRTGGKNKAQVLSHEEMNRELARDEEEFKVFQDMDRYTLHNVPGAASGPMRDLNVASGSRLATAVG
jgi:hypothetical protein